MPYYMGFKAANKNRVNYDQGRVNGIITVIMGMHNSYVTLTRNENKRCKNSNYTKFY